jgi:3-hydroxyacyl-CoA dehydrogenase
MGLNPYLVDKAIAGTFGMPMGPFRWGNCMKYDQGDERKRC